MGISLNKGQGISLTKQNGSPLSKIRLGLGWDAVSSGGGFFGFGGGGEIDLDASAILFDASGREVDVVYYGQLKSRDGSIRHSGDNLTGAGDGDDEQIVVDLTSIPSNVQTVVFTINSYSGQKFNQVKNVFARVVDLSDGRETETVRYDLAESKNNTGVLIAKVARNGAGWDFTAIGEFSDGKTASKMIGFAKNYL